MHIEFSLYADDVYQLVTREQETRVEGKKQARVKYIRAIRDYPSNPHMI